MSILWHGVRVDRDELLRTLGRLRHQPEVERLLLADPATLAAAVRLLLDLHFTPVLAELICAEADLDLPMRCAGSAAHWTPRAG